MFLFLTVIQALVAAALVGVILMQKSEGGGLGVGGGSPSGLMSARGAANFMTRATAVLAVLFVVLSVVLAALAVDKTSGREIDTSLERGAVAPAEGGNAGDPLSGAAGSGDQALPPPAPGESQPDAEDPLAGAAQQ